MFGRKKKERIHPEKPLDWFEVQYIGWKGTYGQIPSNQSVILFIFEDEIVVQFQKIKDTIIRIPYRSMVEIENIDQGQKTDTDRVLMLGLAGYMWKKKQVLTIIKYTHSEQKPQSVAFDFEGGLQDIQSMIYKKMQQLKTKHLP